ELSAVLEAVDNGQRLDLFLAQQLAAEQHVMDVAHAWLNRHFSSVLADFTAQQPRRLRAQPGVQMQGIARQRIAAVGPAGTDGVRLGAGFDQWCEVRTKIQDDAAHSSSPVASARSASTILSTSPSTALMNTTSESSASATPSFLSTSALSSDSPV